MELIYLDHAIKQLAERSITDSEVRAVLSNPNAISPGSVRGRLAYDGSVGRRSLRVVVEGGTDPIIVVTVMWRRSAR